MPAPLLLALLLPAAPPEPLSAEVVIYGGTSAGIAAAVQAARMEKSVLLIEPSAHLGGLTTGGLGATDIGNKAAVGGVAREFYERIGRHYAEPAAWDWQDPGDYRGPRGDRAEIGAENPPAMWTFEPSVAAAVLAEMLAEADIEPLLNSPLRRDGGVALSGDRIVGFQLKDGRTVRGDVFIDATYEGDLAESAGVTMTVGRESAGVYGESANGVRPGLNVKNHRFLVPVDPYVTPGEPSSGLLPDVREAPLPPPGSGDDGVQAYCYRLCATDVPANRKPWPKPAGYDEGLYELLFRNFEAGDPRRPWNPVMMPNRKTDANNNCAVSTDWIGRNHGYPNAADEERAQIVAAHRDYQRGLMWSLANHPRVPTGVRAYFSEWGLAADEFAATDNWPPQLYIREARRMVSDLVMTQAHCEGDAVASEPIGLAAYTMDSHNVWRYVTADGFVQNEGDVQEGGFPPYPIGFGAILPKRGEASNLLVPVCLSASHIAYGSIRMEPVFMVLGQSAATAAALAVERGADVRDVPYTVLRERLEADGQVLEWTGPRPAKGVPAGEIKGTVVDDGAAVEGLWSNRNVWGPHGHLRPVGELWRASRSVGPFVGRGYRYAQTDGDAYRPMIEFTLTAPADGRYRVEWSYPPHPNRSRDTRCYVRWADGSAHGGERDQTHPMPHHPYWGSEDRPGLFRHLHTRTLSEGEKVRVEVAAGKEGGYSVVDAVRLVPAPPSRR